MNALGSSRFTVVSPGLVLAGDSMELDRLPVKAFRGPLDNEARIGLRSALIGHLLRHPDRSAVGVDLQGVPYLHSGCLRVFIDAAQNLHLTSRVLMLGGMSPGVRQVFVSAADVLGDDLFSDDEERDHYLSTLAGRHCVA